MANSVVIIQARTNSSRLPAKALLPIAGMPMVVLAARRAANTGRKVVVATSDESSDDILAQILKFENVKYFRGSLENTLKRFVDVLEEFDNETLVFRLTADNVFPDGTLLDEMAEEFIFRDLKYLSCNNELTGLPYGVSVELTRAKYIREALDEVSNRYDVEHVTPYISRKYGENFFIKYAHLEKGLYRCTVDCLDDYYSVQKVFTKFDSPVQVSLFNLIEALETLPCKPFVKKPVKKLVFGCAQLGMDYGISNSNGKPLQAISDDLIKFAITNGVKFLDTARIYGDSEHVIGCTLNSGWQNRAEIITKLAPFDEGLGIVNFDTINTYVDASVFASCVALRRDTLDVLMLHRASYLLNWNGAVWRRVLEHKNSGRVKALGVSVQTPEELQIVLGLSDVELIQLPFNILDWRWSALVDKVRAEKNRRSLIVHCRSALLQGLLVSDVDKNWYHAHVEDPATITKWLESQVFVNNVSSVVALCLGYVKSMDWIDGVVVGMENIGQLLENIKIFSSVDLSIAQVRDIEASRPFVGEKTLNPATWGE